jgi:hypothetical protein
VIFVRGRLLRLMLLRSTMVTGFLCVFAEGRLLGALSTSALAVALFALIVSCRSGGSGDAPLATSSPQAKAEPAPLATLVMPLALDTGPLASGSDGGLLPSGMRPDLGLAADTPTPLTENALYTLYASLRMQDSPPIAKGPEINSALLEQAKKKLEPRFTVDLGAGRMRWVLDGPGHLLPEGVEIRARTDRLGHVVLFDGGARYRTIGAGSLRSMFQEGRYDFMPLNQAKVLALPGSGYRLGYRTRSIEVSTPAGRVSFEVAKLSELGDAGQLLCRAMLEWVRAAPQLAPCAPDEVPLHAELRFLPRGSTVFEVGRIQKREATRAQLLGCPPATATYGLSELPIASSRTYLSESELAQFHQITDVAIDRAAPRGLLAQNHSDSIRILWVDGVPVAQIIPGGTHLIVGLARGRYQVQWRTPEGASEPSVSIVVPGRTEVGTPEPVR